MKAGFAGSVGEGSVLDFVAGGTDIFALGATVSDVSAEHSDLGATAELEAGFAGRGSDFVAEDTEDLCWGY